ncbi:hypothetical protein HanIR_Chr16g0797921 [Helianthus annuus]|nr:hypothetical protein HanIR_Chr16g0797921 [Helianthus annuus]
MYYIASLSYIKLDHWWGFYKITQSGRGLKPWKPLHTGPLMAWRAVWRFGRWILHMRGEEDGDEVGCFDWVMGFLFDFFNIE